MTQYHDIVVKQPLVLLITNDYIDIMSIKRNQALNHNMNSPVTNFCLIILFNLAYYRQYYWYNNDFLITTYYTH